VKCSAKLLVEAEFRIVSTLWIVHPALGSDESCFGPPDGEESWITTESEIPGWLALIKAAWSSQVTQRLSASMVKIWHIWFQIVNKVSGKHQCDKRCQCCYREPLNHRHSFSAHTRTHWWLNRRNELRYMLATLKPGDRCILTLSGGIRRSFCEKLNECLPYKAPMCNAIVISASVPSGAIEFNVLEH
jgi:hypothetical protein